MSKSSGIVEIVEINANQAEVVDWDQFSIWLTEILKENTVIITFTKKDGTERVMKCTLNPKLLPPLVPLKEGEVKKERKKSETSIVVYDLEAQAWRSFVTKSVKKTELSLL